MNGDGPTPEDGADAPESDGSPDARTDGGATDGVDPRVRERFEDIVFARRVRAAGYAMLFVVVGYLFYKALQAVEWFEAEMSQYVGTFVEALGDFFPFIVSVDGFPFVWFDPRGFLEYWAFMQERNLIYDSEFFAEAGGFLEYPIVLLTGPGGPLGILGEAGVTLSMAIAGTVMGFPLALAFGILGSERVLPFPFNFLFRGVMSSIRAIPALVWALIYVPLGGIGPTTATLAIATDTIGNLGRLYTDELEEIEDGPIEAMETTGADKPQTIVFGMLSQVTTPFIAWTLYIFEINVRIAVTLGIIGGGGLGQILSVQQGLFAFTNMMATILVIMILIISVEMFSQRLRSYLRGDDEAQGLIQLVVGFPQRMAEAVLK
ncbi:phosphonate ABC transporter, permease protein PhnE [Halorarum salinum]|uniref:Phosphonate ABC transporter, permease protein PhnE n=1 Tax=Halorarum salinum TaxID=2743089 RepID=A0A7D5LCC3_9EURY|nr:phosphonate ABC transporter, permease protein PhnE [Halobaculum salinum]QLG63270.1 phosphonate ABC transporter, permease protein PhnE [Halobaculum salinum]